MKASNVNCVLPNVLLCFEIEKCPPSFVGCLLGLTKHYLEVQKQDLETKNIGNVGKSTLIYLLDLYEKY
jgi:hypothetical protein